MRNKQQVSISRHVRIKFDNTIIRNLSQIRSGLTCNVTHNNYDVENLDDPNTLIYHYVAVWPLLAYQPPNKSREIMFAC